jgi:transcription antitermination factor NusB
MSSRHQARIAAFQVLFARDLEQGGAAASVAPPLIPASHVHAPAAIIATLQHHFEHFQVDPENRTFAAELVAKVLLDQSRIDQTIEAVSDQWKIGRMSLTDRALIRLGTAELLNFLEIDAAVTIDEWVEISKRFGEAQSSAFVNGLLDAVAKKHTSKTSAT